METIPVKHSLKFRYSKQNSAPIGSKRRFEAEVLDGGPPEKRPKTVVDSPQCWAVVKTLMQHPTLAETAGVTRIPSEKRPKTEKGLTFSTDIAAKAEGVGLGFTTSNPKALRAAMLKCRFADTIFKAQQKMKGDGADADPRKLKQEKERFERRLVDEKSVLEARSLKLKRQRERDRKAARIALQNMKNTAGIEINWEAEREFEILIGSSSSPGTGVVHQTPDEEIEEEDHQKRDSDEDETFYFRNSSAVAPPHLQIHWGGGGSGGLAPSKSTLRISNLDYSLTNSDLHTFFSTFGKIACVTVLKDCTTRNSKGVAFVQFVFREDELSAASVMHGKILNGKTLSASIAVDNGRAPEFIKKSVYKDKSRCYECRECPKNRLGPRERPVPKKGRRRGGGGEKREDGGDPGEEKSEGGEGFEEENWASVVDGAAEEMAEEKEKKKDDKKRQLF
ncbi:hypothetical protein J1N35_029589 [Gossypium stocksii]|uniref:RRM domain-containing protein n=1 Tax=Gossypium stocksii TaxID=47602 RepID=A0A9D3UZ56_9ROSI|nr:hypothetical protein J1N35_029589 [Gossypium stocksii]